MKLFEINEQLAALIDEDTGEIIDFEAFETLQLARDEKLENIALAIKNLSSDAEELKREKLALAERQAAAEHKRDSLKEYLSQQLAGQKFITPRVACSFRASEAVEVTELDKLPDDYKILEPKPNKTAIKDALKSGKEVAGAQLVNRMNLQIK